MTNKLVLKHRINEHGKCALCGKEDEIAHLMVKRKKKHTTIRAKVCIKCLCLTIEEFLKNENSR